MLAGEDYNAVGCRMRWRDFLLKGGGGLAGNPPGWVGAGRGAGIGCGFGRRGSGACGVRGGELRGRGWARWGEILSDEYEN
jgi:hypothetical protein